MSTVLDNTKHTLSALSARLVACLMAVVLACGVAALPQPALADVRKADKVFGQTVDARGLAVAQCPSIDAKFAYVVDSEGTVYFERDANATTQIASLTKIMTAVVALDAVEAGVVTLDTPVEVSATAAAVGESSAGLQVGDVMDLNAALIALLVPSGNDAAVAIAETVGAALGTNGKSAEETFVEAMNAKATELGCLNTVYDNPHGLDFDQYEGTMHSTAYDTALVVSYAMKNETFRADVALGETSIEVKRAKGGGSAAAPSAESSTIKVDLKPTDEFSQYTEYAIGVKTGFTERAGAAFAAATNKDGVELYAIVLNSSSEAQRFQDAATLTNWVYEHRVSYPLANSKKTTTLNGEEVPVIAEVSHADWIDTTVKATLADPTAAVDIFDLNGNVSQSLEFSKLTGNVHEGDKVGTITFKQRNTVIATQDLIACEEVPAPDFLQGVGIWWDRLFRGFSGQPKEAQSITVNETPLVLDKTANAA